MKNRTSFRRAWACVAIAVLAAGCSSGGKSKGYIADYEAGRYRDALASASKAADRSSGAEKERAALVAGLSAHSMKSNAEAERWLRPLTTSRDRQIAGRAQATMGLIDAQRGNQAGAATRLSQAAQLLPGDEGANAGLNAGDAYMKLGRAEAARSQYTLAFAKATDDHLRSAIAGRLDQSGWTVQVGAFATRMNAEKAARDSTSVATGLGLGQPRVVVATDAGGKTMYLVQVGKFRTKAEADAARSRLGPTTIVAAAGADDAR